MFMELMFFLLVAGFLGMKAYKLYIENKYLTKNLRRTNENP
jgi:hypothetical protein